MISDFLFGTCELAADPYGDAYLHCTERTICLTNRKCRKGRRQEQKVIVYGVEIGVGVPSIDNTTSTVPGNMDPSNTFSTNTSTFGSS